MSPHHTGQVRARDVIEGDFLVGLDNGYVFADPAVHAGEVTIDFHTAQGDEGRLVVPDIMPVTVRRDEEIEPMLDWDDEGEEEEQ